MTQKSTPKELVQQLVLQQQKSQQLAFRVTRLSKDLRHAREQTRTAEQALDQEKQRTAQLEEQVESANASIATLRSRSQRLVRAMAEGHVSAAAATSPAIAAKAHTQEEAAIDRALAKRNFQHTADLARQEEIELDLRATLQVTTQTLEQVRATLADALADKERLVAQGYAHAQQSRDRDVALQSLEARERRLTVTCDALRKDQKRLFTVVKMLLASALSRRHKAKKHGMWLLHQFTTLGLVLEQAVGSMADARTDSSRPHSPVHACGFDAPAVARFDAELDASFGVDMPSGRRASLQLPGTSSTRERRRALASLSGSLRQGARAEVAAPRVEVLHHRLARVCGKMEWLIRKVLQQNERWRDTAVAHRGETVHLTSAALSSRTNQDALQQHCAALEQKAYAADARCGRLATMLDDARRHTERVHADGAADRARARKRASAVRTRNRELETRIVQLRRESYEWGDASAQAQAAAHAEATAIALGRDHADATWLHYEAHRRGRTFHSSRTLPYHATGAVSTAHKAEPESYTLTVGASRREARGAPCANVSPLSPTATIQHVLQTTDRVRREQRRLKVLEATLGAEVVEGARRLAVAQEGDEDRVMEMLTHNRLYTI